MGFESRTFLHRTNREIPPKQTNAQRRIAASAHRQAGGVHQSFMMIHGGSLDLVQGFLHVIEAIDVTKEDGEFSPCPNARMGGCNSGAILALGRAVIFVFLGDLSFYPDSRRRVKSTNRLSLLLGFVFPAAHYARRREVELSEVFPGFPISGIEFNGTLESGATL